MNQVIVVDASVAVKVVLEEEFSDRARTFIADSRRNRRPLFGPPHLASEVTNAIHQKLYHQNITEAEADEALQQFLELPIHLFATPQLYTRASEFSRANGLRSTYDSLYVILAQMLDAEMWTDDRQLLRDIETIAPWVRWIRDYPLERLI
jgi:predicted nucleic acid-binding protein